VERLLADGGRQAGEAGVHALALFGSERSIGTLYQALAHPRYQVRRSALELLVKTVSLEARKSLVAKAAGDLSADVRLAWAELMKAERWPEAVDSLLLMLEDSRDFSSDRGFGNGPHWSTFRVARAAADALQSFTELNPEQLQRLIASAEDSARRDPFVSCASLLALSNKAGQQSESVLIDALEGAGLDGTQRYRVRAQAGAWSLFDRAVAGVSIQCIDQITRAARDEQPHIAAPLLLAAGLVRGECRDRLAAELGARRLSARLELLAVGAASVGVLLAGASPRLAVLSKLAAGTALADLQQDEMNLLVSWSSSLDASNDVEGTTAWVLANFFQLPVRDEAFNARAYDLPERIEVLNLRSFSPAREEQRGKDDGY
jgi:hypothetical protein